MGSSFEKVSRTGPVLADHAARASKSESAMSFDDRRATTTYHIQLQAMADHRPAQKNFPGYLQTAQQKGLRPDLCQAAGSAESGPLQRKAPAAATTNVVQRLQAPGGAPDNAVHNGYNAGAGNKAVESWVTTPTIADTPNGGRPSVDIAGRDWVVASGVGGQWVRFHLINARLGGRGNETRNLVYTRQATNMSGAWRNFEEAAIAADRLRSVFVATEVTYRGAQPRQIGGLQVEESDFPVRIQACAYEHDGAAWAPVPGTATADLNHLNELPPLIAQGLVLSTAPTWTLANRLGITPLAAGRLSQALADRDREIHGADSYNDTAALYANEADENIIALSISDLLETWGAEMAYEADQSIRAGVFTLE